MKKAFTLRFLLTHLAALLGVASSFGQTSITTGAVTPSPVCVGSNVSVAFTTSGAAVPSTTFKAQLSDAAGSFTSPVEIGSGASSPITATIPSGTAAGSAYVVRVILVATAAPSVALVTGSSSSAITVTALPAAPTVTTPVNYNVGATATALTATGASLKWYNVETSGTALPGAPTPGTTASDIGTKSYWVSQTVSSCEGPRAKIDVVVTCATAAPTVTTPVNYNVGQTATALTATGAALKWYDVALNGTALPGAPTPTTTGVGTTSYWVSQTLNGCEGPRAKIDVIVASCPTVAPTITTPVNYNVGATATALTATGTALKWYDVALNGTALSGAPTPGTTASDIGTKSYWVSQTVSGCEGPRAKIDVVVTCATVAPTATTPVNYNVGATATALTATGAGLKWYTVATDGSALPGAPTPGTTASDIGTKSWWVSQTVNGCEGPRAKIDVVVTCATAAPTVTTPVNYNVGATATALTATGSGTLKWYTVATDGSALPSAPTPGTTASDIGTKSWWVSQTVNGCEGPRTKIDVVVTCATAAPTVTTPVNYNTGQTATALTAGGTALKWYDVAMNGTALPGAPTPSTATVGTTSYWVSQTLNGCEGPRSKIDVVVTACPTVAPTVTTPVNYNVGATASPLMATGSGSFNWYTVATNGTALPGAPTPGTTASDIGTKSWWVSQTVSGCEGPRVKIDVVVTCATAAPTVTTPVNYNVGATATALTATGSNLKWYTVATDGVALSGAPTPGTTASEIGTKSWWVSQTLNSCEGPRAKIEVVVTCGTAAPTVTTPVNYSTGQAATALTAGGTALKWYDVALNGTALPGAPTPSTATVGTTSYWVSQTLNSCEGSRAKIDVVVTACPTPAPTVTTPVNYNVGASATALTATGTALKWYTVETNGTALPGAPTPGTTASDIGTKTWWVSQTVSSCEGPRARIDVIVTCATTAPTVITPVTYNVGATASALTANGAGLKWYTVATNGTALPGAPTPGTTASDIGTKSWWVSQTVNGCEGPRAKIDVVVTCATAAPGVTTPVNYCVGATATVLTATGTTLKWYTAETAGTALSSAPTPLTTTVGTTPYWVSQTLNGCEGPRAKIDVVVTQTATPTVSAVEYCKDATATALTAAGATSPKWYTSPSTGTGVTVAPIPLTTTVGVTSYYVTQTIGTCESPRVEQKVTIKAVPAAPTVTNLAYCKNETATALSATAASGATLNWYGTSSTGGTASSTAPTPSTADGDTYYVSQKGTNGCESPRAALVVTIKPLPAIPGVANLEYCQFAGATALTATAVTNASLNWYGTNATGGTASGAAPTPSTQNGGTTSYYVAQTLDGCTSDRAKIDVLIKTTPKPQTQTYFEFCQGASGSQLTATGTNLKWYRDASTSVFQTTGFTPFNEKVEDYYFYVTQTGSNGCESPREEIKIHVKGLPSAEISGSTSIAFGETVSVRIKFGGDGPWTYKLSDGTTGTTANANVDIPVQPTTTTTYFITEVSNACGKGAPVGSAIITVRVPTISTGNPTVAEVCAGKTIVVPFQQSGSFPAGFTFKLQIALTNSAAAFKTVPSVATSSQVTATIPDTTRGGAYFLRIVSSNTAGDQFVPGSVAGIGVTINALPAATISGSKTILLGESADLRLELIGKAPWTLNLNDGTKDSSMTVTLTPFNVVVRPRVTTTYTLTSIVNACGTAAKGTGSARIQVDPILGLEPKANNFAKVYPTVVNGATCTVELDEPVSPKASDIELMTVSGKTLRNQRIRTKTTEVDFSALPVGLYLLKVVNGKNTSVHRVMKQ